MTTDLTPDQRRQLLRKLLERQVQQAQRFPTSFGQRRMWLLDQFDPGNAVYNMPLAVRLGGRLHVDLLERALQSLVRRHDAMRTRFEGVDGEPEQVVDTDDKVSLAVIDISGTDSEDEVLRRAREEATRPFRLAEGPLFRATLFRLGPEDHLLVFVMHHIVSDAWSMSVAMREFIATYQAICADQPLTLPSLSIRYGEYALRQRQQLSGETLRRAVAYWRNRLHGVPPLDLPTDFPRPSRQRHRGGRETLVWTPELAESARRLAREERSTLFMTLLAAYQVLLARHSGQADFAVGTAVSGRLQRDTEPLIGFFVNTLVLRCPLTEETTFRELIREVRQSVMEAMEHQELPFEKLVEELNPPRDPSRNPLFQVSFAYQNDPRPTLDLPGLRITPVKLSSETAKWDLSMFVREVDGSLRFLLEYNADLFLPRTVRGMLEHLQVLVEAAIANPDQPVQSLPMISDAERRTVTVDWNATARDYAGPECLHQLFEAQVLRTPDSIAVVDERVQLTYRDLDARSDRLAARLQRMGIGPESLVGIFLERSAELVVGILAVLKAGAAYVPVDPTYPAERIDFMLADGPIPLVLAQQRLVESLRGYAGRVVTIDSAAADGVNNDTEIGGGLNTPATPDNAAYVLYTSGSTGKPKGVVITHRAICNHIRWMQDDYPMGPEDALLQKTPISFDPSVWEFFAPLVVGGRLVMAQPYGHMDPRYLARVIQQERVTILRVVPTLLRMLLDEPSFADCKTLRRILIGGEALPAELVRRAAGILPIEYGNMYGPTEVTIVSASFRWDGRVDAPTLPIGKPVANCQAYVLDPGLQALPIGVPGELYLGGKGLARGYLNRPELTAERFVPSPFGGGPDAKLYRTGDLVRWLPDGNLEFLSRLDQQVKIRGQRIELGEIRAALVSYPAICEAVVSAVDDGVGNRELAAYFVPARGEVSVAELREFLQRSLPTYMVPTAYLELAALPLMPNGKVDYKALPRPQQQRDERAPYAAPRTGDEQQLADIWAEVLRVERVGAHDNFFNLGGHSLLAAQVASRILRDMKAEIPLREFFQSPTIAELVERIEIARALGRTGSRPPIELAPRDQPLPASLTQEAMWFLVRLEPNGTTYSTYPTLRVMGPLDLSALQLALDELVRRHEILRTTFQEQDGHLLQVIAPPAPRPLRVIDLSGLPESGRDAELRQRLQEEMRRPIDLQQGPIARVTVWRLAAGQHVVMVATHHIIHDGWSTGVLARELGLLYRAYRAGLASPLPELSVQYADFAVWQRKLLQGEYLRRLQQYWVKQLAGVPPLEVPTDFSRPAIRSTRGDLRPCRLSPELSSAVKKFSHAVGATPYMTLLAAFQLLLARFSGQDDFAIGSPVANRTQTETEPLIGYFINMLAFRSKLSADSSFRDLVGQVRNTVLEGFEHQDLTLDQVVEAVNPPRDMSRHPLFQAMFVLQNNPRPEVARDELQFEPFHDRPTRHAAYFELNLTLSEREGTFRGSLSFNTDLFLPETIERMVEQYQLILGEVLAQPSLLLGELPLVSDAESRDLLALGDGTEGTMPISDRIHGLIEAQVARTPDVLALIDGDRVWTYRQLNERANRIAHALGALGMSGNVPVAVRLPRSADLIATLLGVLKAGGAYLPLDLQLPEERLHYTLLDARAGFVITLAGLAKELPAGMQGVLALDADEDLVSSQPVTNPTVRVRPEDLAYIIYTSGSTGRPKGVMLEHRALVNYTLAAVREYGITARDRILQFASISFDAHAEELYTAFTQGATLVIRDDAALDSFSEFLRRCQEWRLTVLSIPTGFWHELTAAIESEGLTLPESLRSVIIGGEAARSDALAKWFECVDPRVRLRNTYGPTETTVVATSAMLNADEMIDGRVPIGRPLVNTRLYVLDSRRRLLPKGVAGELYIGGESVARGYLYRDELTAERFLVDPFSNRAGGRMYRTGDVVRWNHDGNLDFLGRVDNQVKLRGFRIELGEIEQVLCEQPMVASAAVLAVERAPGELRLVAYVKPQAAVLFSSVELRRFLSERVPDYMIPALFVPLDTLPMTTSGKLDRQALPAPDWDLLAGQHEYLEPRTDQERQLAEIWADLLNVPRVGLSDNFFELGGNSLLAIRLTSRVKREFEINFPLTLLFAAPTLSEFAGRVATLRQSSGSKQEAIPRVPRDLPVPMTHIQEDFCGVMRLFAGMPILNIRAALVVNGKIDIPMMQATIDQVVRRHEILRTCFDTADGRNRQIIADQLEVPLELVDLREIPAAERVARARESSEWLGFHIFDPTKLPLIKLQLTVLGDDRHALNVVGSHLVLDGWSIQVLAREVTEIYTALVAGSPYSLPELPIQYRDYAIWIRNRLEGPDGAAMLAFWQHRLEGVRSPQLPTDRPRVSETMHVQAEVEFRLPAAVKAAIERLAGSAGATAYDVMLAVFKLLLSRHCGDDDIAVATAVANRQCPETQDMLGLFINTIIIRTDLSGDPTFQKLIGRVRDWVAEAFEFEAYPLNLLADQLQPARDRTRFPLSQVFFNYLQPDSRKRRRRPGDLQIGRETIVTNPTSTRIDLVLGVIASDRGYLASMAYDTALFDHATIDRLAKEYVALLAAAVAQPDRPISELRALPLDGIQELTSDGATASSELAEEAFVALQSTVAAGAVRGHSLASLRKADSGRPLFCIHGLGGHVAAFLPLAQQLPSQRPIYGLQALGLEAGQAPHERIEAMAAWYVEEIRAVQPQGPYLLSGWSMGGWIALEAAQQLKAAGQETSLLAMFDTHLRLNEFQTSDVEESAVLRWLAPHLRIPLDDLKRLSLPAQWDLISERAEQATGLGVEEIRQLASVCKVQLAALANYRPQPYDGPSVLFRAERQRGVSLDPRWETLFSRLSVEQMTGNHYSMLRLPHAVALAASLDRYLQGAETLGKTVISS